MTLSGGLTAALTAVYELGEATFVELEVALSPMCERIAASHIKRLQLRGLIQYDAGIYTITPEGKKALGHG